MVNSFGKHLKLKLPLVNRTKSLSTAEVRNHEMLLSAIYGILFAACWLYANFQLCCATDEAVDKQTARICMENCSHLTKDVYTTPLSSEIWTQQTCYKECLRKLVGSESNEGKGKQDKFEIYEKSHIFKRIRRETCRKFDKDDPCVKDSERNFRGIPQENITITVHGLNGTTGRFYVNISWIPPPESVNWTGYKLVYGMGYDYEYYCCRDLNKTSTYAIADNSSYGLLGGGFRSVNVKVFTLPLRLSNDSRLYFKAQKIPGNDWSTDPATTEITSTSTDPATTEITSTSTDPVTTEITSPSNDTNKTQRNPIIAVAIVVPISALLALLAYWYFRHPRDQSSKAGVSDTEFQFDAFIIYSSADEE